MNQVENPKPVQAEERVDHVRREAMLRMAKYTAPAMLALLLSSQASSAVPCVSLCVPG